MAYIIHAKGATNVKYIRIAFSCFISFLKEEKWGRPFHRLNYTQITVRVIIIKKVSGSAFLIQSKNIFGTRTTRNTVDHLVCVSWIMLLLLLLFGNHRHNNHWPLFIVRSFVSVTQCSMGNHH